MNMVAGERGVSPIIAEILMVTLVLACAIIAYLVLFQIPAIVDIPPVAVQITKSGQLVTLSHLNGEPLAKDRFYVTVNGHRMPDSSVNIRGGSYPWSPGSSLLVTYTGTDAVRDVKLVYTEDTVSFVLAAAYFTVSQENQSVCSDPANPRAFAAGFWALNGGSGSTAYDGTCNATKQNGTIINGTWKTCANQSVLAFNGASTNVTIPNSAAITPTNAVTYEAWAYPVEQKTANVVQMNDWNGNNIYQDKWLGWRGGVTLANGTKFTIDWSHGGNRQPSLFTWYHLVLTYDGSYLRLYVNGIEEKSLAFSGSLKTSTVPLIIGSAGTQKYFNGNIADVGMYQTALTPAQIASRYTGKSPGVCPA